MKNPSQQPARSEVGSQPNRNGEVSVETFVMAALEQYQAPLVSYAITILRDVERAKEVVRDTFIRLCQRDFRVVREDLKTWLYTTCRDTALEDLRKGKRSQPPDDIRWQRVAGAGLAPEEKRFRDERFDKMMAFLDRLPTKQREVVILKLQQQLSFGEISKITGQSPSHVASLLHSGLKQMREFLPNDLKI